MRGYFEPTNLSDASRVKSPERYAVFVMSVVQTLLLFTMRSGSGFVEWMMPFVWESAMIKIVAAAGVIRLRVLDGLHFELKVEV